MLFRLWLKESNWNTAEFPHICEGRDSLPSLVFLKQEETT